MAIRFRFQPGDQEISSDLCMSKLNLLAHAQAAQLDIGSRCGGHGVCGGDRIRIPAEATQYFSPVRDREREHLSKDELEAGYRLACQCFPETDTLDITLEVKSVPADGHFPD